MEMANASGYSPHVVMIPDTLPQHQLWDTLLGVILILCTAVGAPGNALAFKFFFSSKRKDVATALYRLLCATDCILSLITVPITASLLSGRQPRLFNSLGFCVVWSLLFKFLQKLSIFLVMLLSVSRTVGVALPFASVYKSGLIGAVMLYSCILVVLDGVHMNPSAFMYISTGPFCTDSPLQGSEGQYAEWVTVSKTLTTVELGLPAVITFFSFIVCTYKLYHATPLHKKQKTRATITVAIFTGLFLCCNLPFFTVMVLNSLTRALGFTYPEPFFAGPFMSQYSWLIAKIFLTAVNMACNPIVYFFRIMDFRMWIQMRSHMEEDQEKGQKSKAWGAIEMVAGSGQRPLYNED